jgi:hypothetical protein
MPLSKPGENCQDEGTPDGAAKIAKTEEIFEPKYSYVVIKFLRIYSKHTPEEIVISCCSSLRLNGRS